MTDIEVRERRPILRISYDHDLDFLLALLPGEVVDGHLDDETDEPLDGLFLYRRGENGPLIGFGVDDAFAWDPNENPEPVVWHEPRFDVPTLALRDAPIGAIVLAARQTIDGSSTDVMFFDLAVAAGSDGNLDFAEFAWRACLEAGEMKAHFGLGYTLVEMDRPREAYGHLAMYTEICPRNSWAWLWRGRAAQEMGETAEARHCFERALACEADGSYETDAAERLAALENE